MVDIRLPRQDDEEPPVGIGFEVELLSVRSFDEGERELSLAQLRV